MAFSCKFRLLRAALVVMLVLVAGSPVLARARKPKRPPVVRAPLSVVTQPRPPPPEFRFAAPVPPTVRPGNALPINPRQLALPYGMTLTLDRSLRVELNLAELLQPHAPAQDTYSLTFEAQSGSAWLWLRYGMPRMTSTTPKNPP